jgi:hypothetical protein
MARGDDIFTIECEDGTRHTIVRRTYYADAGIYGRGQGDGVDITTWATFETDNGTTVKAYTDGTYRVAGSDAACRRVAVGEKAHED